MTKNLGTNKLIAIGVIPVIAISVVLGVYFGTSLISPSNVTVNSTTVTIRATNTTTTSEPSTSTSSSSNSSLSSSGNYLEFPISTVTKYALNGTWNLTARDYLNGTTLFVNSTLVYFGNATAEYQIFGGPIGAVTLTAPNETVSDWTGIVPDYVVLENVTYGRTFTSKASIPTDALTTAPGNYTINIEPRISTSNGTSLGPLLNVNLTVTSVPSYGITMTNSGNVTVTWTNGSSAISSNSSIANPVLTANKVFSYDDIPDFFLVGNFTIQLLQNGTGNVNFPDMYGTTTQVNGFVFAFNVTTPEGQNSTTLYFLWTPPCSENVTTSCTTNGWTTPVPLNTTGNEPVVNYYAAKLVVGGITNATGMYFEFQEWDQIQYSTATTTTTTMTGNNFTSTTFPATTTISLNQSNGSVACQSLGSTASWNGNNNACILTGSQQISLTYLVFEHVVLTIYPGISLILENSGSEFLNYGTIINNGTMEILNTFVSYGALINYGTIWTNTSITGIAGTTFIPNGGTTNNYGVINIYGYYKSGSSGNSTTDTNGSSYFLSGGSYRNGGVLNNYGTINSTGALQNFAPAPPNSTDTINNFGTVMIGPGGQYQSLYPSEVLNNYGTITNEGSFVNNGTFYSYCGSSFNNVFGTFSGNPMISTSCTTTTTLGGAVITTVSEDESSSAQS